MPKSLLSALQLSPLKLWLLALILVVATFVRFYNLENTLVFQGDQGRDALIVSRIFRQHDPVFIGPVTSVGNMYLGPLYYYFMLPFLWLSYPSPMGPVYAVAALGVVTVALIYFLGRQLVGERAALIAAGLYSLASIPVQYSRFSWNPNVAPLVSLLMIFYTYQAWKKNPRYWVVVAICFSVIIQLHYLALLSAGGAGLIWLWSLWDQRSKKNFWTQARPTLIATGIGALIFLASFAPLVLFDAKHDWLNARAFTKLFTKERSFKVVSTVPWTTKVSLFGKELHGRSMHVLFEFTIGQHRQVNTFLVIAVLGWLGWQLQRQRSSHWAGLVVLSAFLATGIVGTAFYNFSIFDHYIAYLFPVTFLIYGAIISHLLNHKITTLVSLAASGYFVIYNVSKLPLHTAGWTIADMKATADSIASHFRPGETYNIVLLSESKDLYGQNYRYFLSTTDFIPLEPEQSSQADTLIIINENQRGVDVVNLPIYEIAIFPTKKADLVYNIPDGPEIIFLRNPVHPQQ